MSTTTTTAPEKRISKTVRLDTCAVIDMLINLDGLDRILTSPH